jgi:hypothetical protein
LATGLFAAVFGLPALAGPGETQPPVAQRIARVIEAYGGEKALREARGYHASGNQWATQVDQPIHAERWFARPDRLRLDLDYPDHREIRITEGDVGWLGSSVAELEPAIPLKLHAMRLQTARLDTPLRLLEQSGELVQRDDDASGRAVVRLAISAELYIDYHIDPKTSRITRVTTGMTSPHRMEFICDYDEFHEVGGVLVPFHEVSYAGTTVISKFVVTGFEWNPESLERHLRPAAGSGD